MPPKQMSRAQREERRATLRLLAFGGATLAVVGGGAVGLMALSEPPALEGENTLAARLDAAGLRRHAFRLTGEGDPDVLIIGSSDCVHCNRLVSEGMEAFLAAARKGGMAVDYLALPTGPGSIASAQALSCFANSADPVAALRATYAYSKEVTAGLDEADRADRLAVLMREAGTSGDAQLCAAPSGAQEVVDRGRTIASAFALQGTPGFYVASASDPQTIRMFSGYAGESGLLRQLDTARSS